jgi:hypothetical protein
MKIQTTVTESKTVDIEIELPYYCKVDDHTYKVVSEDKTIQVTKNSIGTYTDVTAASTWLFKKDISEGEVISASEFETAYLNALDTINSLCYLQEVAA